MSSRLVYLHGHHGVGGGGGGGGGGGAAPGDSAESINAFKVEAVVIIFLVALVGGLLPLKVREFKNRDRLLSLGNAFAGGIFICAGFSHMLSEAIEAFEEVHIPAEIPLLYCMCGIFTTLFVEKVLLPFYLDSRGIMHHHHSPPSSLEDGSKRKSTGDGSKTDEAGSVDASGAGGVAGSGGGCGHDHGALLASAAAGASDVVPYDSTGKPPSASSSDTASMHRLNMYILTILLSMHSLLEGMALGVETAVTDGWRVLAAIGAHKSFAAAALGLSLVRAQLDAAVVARVIVVFALMTPAGVVIGTLFSISFDGGDGGAASGGVQAIASGSFIYVALVEILLHELDGPRDRWLKFLCMLMGVVVMLEI